MDVALETESNAIESIYRTDGDRLWRSVLTYSGDAEVASDAVAEAFAQVLRRGSAVRDPSRWVWRAAFRIAAGELKSCSRLVRDVPDSSYELPDVPIYLATALESLPERQRAFVILHYYADLTISDVAHALGTTSAAAKMGLMRARRRLGALLESDHA